MGQHYTGRLRKGLPLKCLLCMSHLSGYSTKQSSYLLCNHTISCGLCDVSYVLTLALINHLIFFIHRLLHNLSCLIHFVVRLPDLKPHAPRFLMVDSLGSYPFLSSHDLDKTSPRVCSLLIGDCRVHCCTSCNGGQ